jgi:hypothetical protein
LLSHARGSRHSLEQYIHLFRGQRVIRHALTESQMK